MIGAKPHTDWLAPALSLDKDGFVLTGRDMPGTNWALEGEPYPFETSRPGVFAAGDVRHGSAKRLAGAVGEGSVAVGPSTATWLRPPHPKDRPRRDGLDRHKLGRSRDAEPRCAA